jgi:hypothetical protein
MAIGDTGDRCWEDAEIGDVGWKVDSESEFLGAKGYEGRGKKVLLETRRICLVRTYGILR